MELRSAGGAVTLCLFVLCLLVSTSDAHNITRMLAKYPEFSTFNRYLSLTHLATDINRRLTITVCAIDNAAMNALISKRYSIPTIKNVLSLHVFVDYWGAKKLHGIKHGTTLTSTMFQATGTAAGTTGYVNITNLKGGKVGFSVEDTNGVIGATFVKSIIERPYNISVIQISSYLDSPTAEAPTPPPPQVNLTVLMSKQGCKAFADLLTSTGVIGVFDENVEAGLTLFCPIDAAVTAFMPKYKNLTAGKKESLLLYHGTPIFFSLQLLKSNNELQSTLATEKVGTYDFTVKNSGETVTLQTKVQTSKILNTLIAQDPVAVYSIDKVLQPKELFKIPRAPAPVGSKLKPEGSVAEGPIDSDETTADGSGSSSISCGLWMGSILAVWFLGLFTIANCQVGLDDDQIIRSKHLSENLRKSVITHQTQKSEHTSHSGNCIRVQVRIRVLVLLKISDKYRIDWRWRQFYGLFFCEEFHSRLSLSSLKSALIRAGRT